MNGKTLDLLIALFHGITLLITIYVVGVTLLYLALLLISFKKLYKEKGLKNIQYDNVLNESITPPLSIIVPAYNEEANIVWSVRSLLGINYKVYEIVVVNDGSRDETVQRMISEFQMVEIEHKVLLSLKDTKPIRSVYRSARYSNLVLVDKENGGKADALNAGINISKHPYFVSLDGDTVLDPNAFIKVMKPIIDAKPGEEIIATGGSVGIANGSYVDSGFLGEQNVALSRNPIVVMQVIEYLRAFLMGRIGLSRYNLLLIVSGAFGVFKKDWVVKAGGYEVGTIGEDMELVVRLHAMIREEKSKARIVYVPDPVCWTEAPENFKILKRQRTRWHRGLFESLWRHKRMIFNPKYGRIGLVAMPYFTVVELLGPIIEFFGYVLVAAGLFMGTLSIKIALLLALAMLSYGMILSMGAVLLEEWSWNRYRKVSDLVRLFFYAFTESLWYRPIAAYWRLIGLIEAIRGKRHQWGEMTRKGSAINSKQRDAAS
ncbi:glycosyltransferase [Paenibacillus oenotherae]|uniref:Glycosyltransferase n=1 Tax=Paenibacillus oenotherae TaxID=1435645 RepID=A0ABS7D9R2_9BACL|nr:glycosyltransferase family 2 protein [Paenibacillus oenotherae]MBW7476689.1 glycosyltransferase [Paenibacillus oenotherae]